MHRPGHESSIIAHTIDQHAGAQDSDANLNPCEVGAMCCLSTGIEACFVAMTSHYAINRLCDAGYDTNFQKSLYIPNIRAEQTAGFDLSLGNAFARPRVRTMHKHLYGNNTFNKWCDEEWSWSISPKNEIDHRHLRSLVQNFENEDIFQPFLILHICFCLHEYRRMGTTIDNMTIPDIDSPLRTIVVNLGSILNEQNEAGWNQMLSAENFLLEVNKTNHERNEAESENEYLLRIADLELFEARVSGNGFTINLPIITLPTLVDDHISQTFDMDNEFV